MANDIVGSSTDFTSDWNWEEKHVSQSYTVDGEQQFNNIGDIVESGTVLIAAGPADLGAATFTSASTVDRTAGVRIVPIGLVENATIAMNKPLSRIFEIGSKLSYIIPGRTVGEIALARVLFDGASLLKVLYRGEVKTDTYDGSKNVKNVEFNSNSGLVPGKDVQNIGSGHIAMNLASTFFDQPIGLAFYFRDQENQEVGQIYFEGCRVSTYNMGISANMNVLTESVRMEFTQCVPITSGANFGSPSLEHARRNGTAGLPDVPVVGNGTLSPNS